MYELVQCTSFDEGAIARGLPGTVEYIAQFNYNFNITLIFLEISI
jgi:hypothetical protein